MQFKHARSLSTPVSPSPRFFFGASSVPSFLHFLFCDRDVAGILAFLAMLFLRADGCLVFWMLSSWPPRSAPGSKTAWVTALTGNFP